MILVLLLVFFLVVIVTKKVSLGSMIAALTAPVAAWLMYEDRMLTGVIAFLCILLLIRHKENIRRLLRGEEKNFSWKRGKS